MVNIKDLNKDFSVLKRLLKKSNTLVTMELVRKSKKFNSELATKKDNAKLLRKKRRNDIEIEHLKTIHYLHLLKTALTKKDDFQKIINSETSTPEERSEARVLTHKMVKEKIVNLRKKVDIDKDAEDLSTIFESLQANKKLKDKIKKRSKIIKEDKLNRKNKKVSRENSKVSVVEEDSDSSSESININESNENHKKLKKIKKSSISEDVNDDNHNSSNSENEESNQKSVDSFFFTSSGKHYMSTAKTPESDAQKKVKTKPVEPQTMAEGTQVLKPRRFKDNSSKKLINFKETDNDKSKKQTKSNFDKAKTNALHPSWAAKKKAKTTIAKFQGKKMVFDDSQNNGIIKDVAESEKLHPSWDAKKKSKTNIQVFKGKKTTFDEPSTEKNTPRKNIEEQSEKVHPSWAAKMKSKPIITKFEGKKIVFDD